MYIDDGAEWKLNADPGTINPPPPPPPPPGTSMFVGAGVGSVAATNAAVTGYPDLIGRPLTVRRVYFASSWPASYSASIINGEAGVRRISADFKPTSATTPSKLNTFLKSCNTAGVDMVISLFHEMTDDFPNSGDYINLITPYIPVLRSNGYPHIFNPTNFTMNRGTANPYYAGDSLVDQVCVDYYCQGSAPGSGGDTLDVAANFADTHGKPLGLCELGVDHTKFTETQGDAFLNYNLNFFKARRTAGKANCDITYFSTDSAGSFQSGPASYITIFRNMFDALNAT
jgi:hypothetical protein